jgi:hypothetical protein
LLKYISVYDLYTQPWEHYYADIGQFHLKFRIEKTLLSESSTIRLKFENNYYFSAGNGGIEKFVYGEELSFSDLAIQFAQCNILEEWISSPTTIMTVSPDQEIHISENTLEAVESDPPDPIYKFVYVSLQSVNEEIPELGNIDVEGPPSRRDGSITEGPQSHADLPFEASEEGTIYYSSIKLIIET